MLVLFDIIESFYARIAMEKAAAEQYAEGFGEVKLLNNKKSHLAVSCWICRVGFFLYLFRCIGVHGAVWYFVFQK